MIPQLRPYQLRALAAVREAYRAGHRRILLVSPTGSGKTVLGSALVAAHARRTPGARAVWFAHRRELVRQAAGALEAYGLEVGHSGLGASHVIQVVMAQGALAAGTVPAASLVVPDEAHHYCGAPEWSTLMQVYPDALIVGLTATPERADGAALDLFTHLIEVTSTREMVELWLESEGRQGLVPVETYRPSAPEKLGALAKTPCQAYLETGLRGRLNVVFAPDVASATRFCEEFTAAGVRACVVHGGLKADERAARLGSFGKGTDVICNVHVLTEGWDFPPVSVITLASRCGSYSGLVQRVGRGRRPHPGKSVCTVLDLPGVTHALGDIDEERTFSLDGLGVRRKEVSPWSFCRVCGSIMPADGACENCGRPRDEREITISGSKLDKFARYKADDEATRAYRLARWIRESKAAGMNWKRNLYRYAAVYGAQPAQRVISLAFSIVNGAEWCDRCGHSAEGKRCKCKTGSSTSSVAP